MFSCDRPRSLLTVILLAALVAVTAAACGSSGENRAGGEGAEQKGEANSQEAQKEPTALELVRTSERTTTEAESARFSMTMDFPAPEGSPPMGFAFEGAMDFAEQESVGTMLMPMLGEVEMRTIGTKVYQKFPPEFRRQAMPPGKSWIVADFDEQMREQLGAGYSEMQGNAASAPQDQLAYLRSVGSVEKVGEEEVRGVPTIHYRAVIDLDKDFALTQGDEDLEKVYAQMKEQIGTSELPTEVWLDEEGRVRRYEMTLPLPETTVPGEATAPQPPEGEVTIAIEYYDFGTPVEVSPPPPGQTISLDELMETQEPAA